MIHSFIWEVDGWSFDAYPASAESFRPALHAFGAAALTITDLAERFHLLVTLNKGNINLVI